MPKDPVCGMTVNETTSFKAEKNGQMYYFCSAHCKDKFLSQAPRPASVTGPSFKVVYTCPMHPEVRQNKPGDCPKCGMAL